MFDFPLEICHLLSLSQLLAVWKSEKEFGCLAPGEQVDFGKNVEVTDVLLRPSTDSQEQLTCSKTEFSLGTEAVEELMYEELQEKLEGEAEKKKSPKTIPKWTSARRESEKIIIIITTTMKYWGWGCLLWTLLSAPSKLAAAQSSQTAVTLLSTWLSWGVVVWWPWPQSRHHHPHHSSLPVATGVANSTFLRSHAHLWVTLFVPCLSVKNDLADALLPAMSRALRKEGKDSWWLGSMQGTVNVMDTRGKSQDRNNLLSRASKANIPSPLSLIPRLLQKLLTII